MIYKSFSFLRSKNFAKQNKNSSKTMDVHSNMHMMISNKIKAKKPTRRQDEEDRCTPIRFLVGLDEWYALALCVFGSHLFLHKCTDDRNIS